MGNQKNLPEHWFYMTKEGVTMSAVKEALVDMQLDVQYWEEAEVIEVELAEKTSIDFEKIDLDMGDDYSNAFVAKHGVSHIYYISFRKEDYEKCIEVLKQLRNRCGGLLCGDTEDFEPIFS